jgi:hypothetical protein
MAGLIVAWAVPVATRSPDYQRLGYRIQRDYDDGDRHGCREHGVADVCRRSIIDSAAYRTSPNHHFCQTDWSAPHLGSWAHDPHSARRSPPGVVRPAHLVVPDHSKHALVQDADLTQYPTDNEQRFDQDRQVGEALSTSSLMRTSNLAAPTMPTLRPKLRRVPRQSETGRLIVQTR